MGLVIGVYGIGRRSLSEGGDQNPRWRVETSDGGDGSGTQGRKDGEDDRVVGERENDDKR